MRKLRDYERQRDEIYNHLKDNLNIGDAYMYGSVVRLQGPYNDIDVMSVDGSGVHDAPSEVLGLPLQLEETNTHQVTQVEATTSREITAAIDYLVISDEKDTLESALEGRKSRLVKSLGYVVHLLALEEVQETSAKDIQQNSSFYAAKRKAGSKRSIMRTGIIADAMYSNLGVGDERSRFERLNELGVIDDEMLVAMFSVQAMLPHWRNGEVSSSDWESNLDITRSWVEEITKEGLEFASRFSSDSYSDSQIQVIEDRNLILNRESSTEGLLALWRRQEGKPDTLKEIAGALVQHDNFPRLEIMNSNALDSLPDIKYLLRQKP